MQPARFKKCSCVVKCNNTCKTPHTQNWDVCQIQMSEPNNLHMARRYAQIVHLCEVVKYRYGTAQIRICSARAVWSGHVQFYMERTIIKVCMINDCWLWFTHCTFRPPPILKCSHNERVALLEWRLCSYRPTSRSHGLLCVSLVWLMDLRFLCFSNALRRVRTLYSYTVCCDHSMASDPELDSVGLVQFFLCLCLG